MDFINYALSGSIIVLAETIIYCIFYMGLYERRQRGWKYGLILAFYPISLLVGGYLADQGILPIILKVICLLIVGCIITKLLFYSNWRSIVIHQIIFFGWSLISDSFALGSLSMILYGVELSKVLNNFALMMQVAILSKMFNFFIILIFIKKFGKKTNHYTILETLIFMLHGIIGIACLLLILYLSMNHNSNHKLTTVFLIIASILTLLSYFIFYSVLENYIKKRKLEQEVTNVHFYNQGQYEYYATLEQENLNMKKIYQEMKKHLYAIQRLNKESTDIFDTYIKKCIEEVESYNEFFDTGNKLADIILYEKCSKAKKNNIKTKIMIQKDSLNNLEMLDLCTILTNSFDNAMAGCIQCKEERFIQIKTLKNDAALIFTVKNNYETLPTLNKKGELIDCKRNKAENVIGMQSLKMAASKYNGDVQISIDKEKKEFLLIVMIPLAYQKAS